MIGTNGAVILLFVEVIVASALGIGAGALTCLVLRRPWSLHAVLIDAVVAPAVGVITACAVVAIDHGGHVFESPVVFALTMAAGSVVVRHLISLRVKRPVD